MAPILSFIRRFLINLSYSIRKIMINTRNLNNDCTLTYKRVYNMQKFKGQFIINEKGQKTAAILPIEEYEELLEDLHDLAVVAERRG